MKKSKKSGTSTPQGANTKKLKSIEDFEKHYLPMIDILDEGSYLLDYELGNNIGIDANRIWTLVSGDRGNDIIMAGRHHVNHLAYIITEVPWETGNEQFIVENNK